MPSMRAACRFEISPSGNVFKSRFKAVSLVCPELAYLEAAGGNGGVVGAASVGQQMSACGGLMRESPSPTVGSCPSPVSSVGGPSPTAGSAALSMPFGTMMIMEK